MTVACAADPDGGGDAGVGGADGSGGAAGGSAGSGGAGGASGRVPKKHRALAEGCDDMRGPGSNTNQSEGSCTTDADCTEGRNGRCEDFRGDIHCSYDTCFDDDGCDGTHVCACGGGFWSDNNVCLREGNCRTDGDCGPGGYCSPSLGDCGEYSGVVGYFCHTAEDECVDDEDCEGGDHCAFDPVTDRWMCSDTACVG